MNAVTDYLEYYLGIFVNEYDMEKFKKKYDKNAEYITCSIKNSKASSFEVVVEIPSTYSDFHSVRFQISNNELSSFGCDCGRCFRYSPCEHLTLAYYYLLDHPEYLENPYYKDSFQRLRQLFSNPFMHAKTQLQLEIYLSPMRSHNSIKWEVNLKIGENRLYSLKSKMRPFYEAYSSTSPSTYFLGKELTYSNQTHRFSEEDEKIMNFFVDRVHNYNLSSTEIPLLDSFLIKQFLTLLAEKTFYFDIDHKVYKIDHISTDFQLDSKLEQKEDGSFGFYFQLDHFYVLTNDFEYVLSGGNLYRLNFAERKALQIFLENTNGHEITFKEEELSEFTSYLLPKVRLLSKKIETSEELQKEIEIETPVNRIYFDYKRGILSAEVKYFYPKQNQEIPRDSKISLKRDYETENRACSYLEDNDFVLKGKKYVCEDSDKQGYFLENKLSNIPDGFEFFASNAVKKMNVVSTPSISSGLSLGSDEWLRCDFEFGGLSLEDVKDVISSVKENKKYSKLKNGTIVKLDRREEITDFYELLENFDIDYQKLDDLNFQIPKYKALYLDHYIERENYINIEKANDFQDFLKKFNEYKNSQIEKLDEYDNMLRDYQVTGVNFLMSLAKCGFGGILADEMGLGKTFQTITYIKHRLSEDSSLKFLIVVPTSLLYNWKSEFEKYAPNIQVLIMNMLPSVRKTAFEHFNEFSVIITSYGLVRQDIEEYMKYLFDTCVIDEAQNIKNIHAGSTKSLKLIQARTKLALTGTPIENSLLELYSIFDFLMPGYFSTLAKFNEKFQKPIIKEDSREAMELLNMAVAPFILRRKKMDVLNDLPDKIERKIMIDLTEEQKKVYYAHLELAKQEIQEEVQMNGFSKSQIKILSILTRLRQICIEPSLFVEGYHGGSSKIDAILEFLDSAILEGHKILLFSQFTSALHILENKFHEKGVSYFYLDGGTKAKDRLRMVNQFNEDDTSVFLISLKAGGTGLNLTGADIVIHLDFWWNPAVENQATDRAHRIGQKKIVEVVKFVCQGTIEERVLELQEKKKKLSDGILEGEDRDQVVLSKLTEKDIQKLLDMEG